VPGKPTKTIPLQLSKSGPRFNRPASSSTSSSSIIPGVFPKSSSGTASSLSGRGGVQRSAPARTFEPKAKPKAKAKAGAKSAVSSSSSFSGKCFRCQRLGHRAEDCRAVLQVVLDHEDVPDSDEEYVQEEDDFVQELEDHDYQEDEICITPEEAELLEQLEQQLEMQHLSMLQESFMEESEEEPTEQDFSAESEEQEMVSMSSDELAAWIRALEPCVCCGCEPLFDAHDAGSLDVWIQCV
jgi:hypothetical protein